MKKTLSDVTGRGRIMAVYKVLVTGSRSWTNEDLISKSLLSLYTPDVDDVIIIHGGCGTGADSIADNIARQLNYEVRVYPAEWEKYGKSAGPRRNADMILKENTESEPVNLCLAFSNDLATSRGTKHCVECAKNKGIQVRLISE